MSGSETFGLLLLLVVSTITTVAIAEQPESLPTVSFFPHEIYLDEQTRNFTVSVNIENLQASHRFAGIELQLDYDATVLGFPEMIEGEFLKDFEKLILFIIEMNVPNFGILLLPPYTRFPEGNGTVVAFSFTVSGLLDLTINLTSSFAAADGSVIPLPDDCCYVRSIWNRADVNSDGKVNIMDIRVFAEAHGSTPGQFRWNTNVDLDRNQVVNIKDAVMIAKSFGKTAIQQ